MTSIEIKFEDIVFDKTVYSFCKSEKYTCPNYGTSWSCPPAASFLKEKISKFLRFFLIYLKVDIESLSNLNDEKMSKNNETLDLKKFNELINLKTTEEITKFLERYNEPFEESFVLWPEKCKICTKNGLECSYQTKIPCRNPTRMRSSMTGAGVNTDQTARNVNIVLEWPPSKYSYRFGLVCFK